MNEGEKLHEVRLYNEGAIKVIFYSVTGAETEDQKSCWFKLTDQNAEQGKGDTWVETDPKWLSKWYPQVYADILIDPVDDGRWKFNDPLPRNWGRVSQVTIEKQRVDLHPSLRGHEVQVQYRMTTLRYGKKNVYLIAATIGGLDHGKLYWNYVEAHRENSVNEETISDEEAAELFEKTVEEG